MEWGEEGEKAMYRQPCFIGGEGGGRIAVEPRIHHNQINKQMSIVTGV